MRSITRHTAEWLQLNGVIEMIDDILLKEYPCKLQKRQDEDGDEYFIVVGTIDKTEIKINLPSNTDDRGKMQFYRNLDDSILMKEFEINRTNKIFWWK